jgi:hypothetical protein
VSFCRDRFSATGDLGYRGIRGADREDTGSLYSTPLLLLLLLLLILFIALELKPGAANRSRQNLTWRRRGRQARGRRARARQGARQGEGQGTRRRRQRRPCGLPGRPRRAAGQRRARALHVADGGDGPGAIQSGFQQGSNRRPGNSRLAVGRRVSSCTHEGSYFARTTAAKESRPRSHALPLSA